MLRSNWHLLWTAAWLTASLLAAETAHAQAGPKGLGCKPETCTPPPAIAAVVPRVAYRAMSVPIVVYKPEVRQKTVTVVRDVIETKTVARTVTMLVPEERIQSESYAVCTLAEEEVACDVTVMVPQTEIREGVRTILRPMMAHETRTIARDAGRWICKPCVDANGCVKSCRVWEAKIVWEEVRVPICKMEAVQEPYRYEVTVCRPEVHTVTRRVCRPVIETKTREVAYTVCVPKQVQREFTVAECQSVAEERVVNCLATVAEIERRELQVPVVVPTSKKVGCTIR